MSFLVLSSCVLKASGQITPGNPYYRPPIAFTCLNDTIESCPFPRELQLDLEHSELSNFQRGNYFVDYITNIKPSIYGGKEDFVYISYVSVTPVTNPTKIVLQTRMTATPAPGSTQLWKFWDRDNIASTCKGRSSNDTFLNCAVLIPIDSKFN